MTVISLPADMQLRNISWRLNSPIQRVRSQWDGFSQAVRIPGASRWMVSGEFVPLVGTAAANQWIGFFAQLDGSSNTFRVNASEGGQTTFANPTVNGGSQTGSTLNLAGLPASPGIPVLPAGSRATIPLSDGTVQLVVLTADLKGAAGGTAAMSFRPPLRASPTSGVTVEIKKPYAEVALIDPIMAWDVVPGKIYGITFDAEEVF